jgi:hypothetical protein
MCELLHTGDVFWPSSGDPLGDADQIQVINYRYFTRVKGIMLW